MAVTPWTLAGSFCIDRPSPAFDDDGSWVAVPYPAAPAFAVETADEVCGVRIELRGAVVSPSPYWRLLAPPAPPEDTDRLPKRPGEEPPASGTGGQ